MAKRLTGERLLAILRECAGEEEGAEGVDKMDQEFTVLGYDSLALLEATARVSSEFGVDIPEDALADTKTPGQFLVVVNRLVAS